MPSKRKRRGRSVVHSDECDINHVNQRTRRSSSISMSDDGVLRRRRPSPSPSPSPPQQQSSFVIEAKPYASSSTTALLTHEVDDMNGNIVESIDTTTTTSTTTDVDDDDDDDDETLMSLWSFLCQEARSPQVCNDDFRGHRERIFNFITLPYYFEKFAWFGYWLCISHVLFQMTFMPIRIVLTIVSSVVCPYTKLRLSCGEREDVVRTIILFTSLMVLFSVDLSRVYHYVRHQSFIKIYVLFNMLQVFDKMLSSLGEDVMDAMFSMLHELTSTPSMYNVIRLIAYIVLSTIYTAVHSLVQAASMIALNVSVNSKNTSLLVILISTNFVELKTSIFRKFSVYNMFQIACNDVVERTYLTCFLVCIYVQNLSHVGSAHSIEWLSTVGVMCFVMYLTEIVVDWIKHGFLGKFNFVSPKSYITFEEVLCTDVVNENSPTGDQGRGGVYGGSVMRRLGFAALPLTCLVIRVTAQSLHVSVETPVVRAISVVVLIVLLMSIYFALRVYLLGHACKVVLQLTPATSISPTALELCTSPTARSDTNGPEPLASPYKQSFSKYGDFQQINREDLLKTTRNSLTGSRIPRF